MVKKARTLTVLVLSSDYLTIRTKKAEKSNCTIVNNAFIWAEGDVLVTTTWKQLLLDA